MTKAFVLLSGGIDSTTCLFLALEEFRRFASIVNGPKVEAVSIDYGQRHRKEISHAVATCGAYGIQHHILNLAGIIPDTTLTNWNAKIPDVSYAELEGVSPTYVPFRNGLMLSVLASFVHGRRIRDEEKAGGWPTDLTKAGAWSLYFGAHREDAANFAYPDCTPEFTGSMANAIMVATYGQVRLHTPLQWLGKADIIRLGERLAVPWARTWSCYRGGDLHCGTCPTCRARRQGFKDAGVKDPTQYATPEA